MTHLHVTKVFQFVLTLHNKSSIPNNCWFSKISLWNLLEQKALNYLSPLTSPFPLGLGRKCCLWVVAWVHHPLHCTRNKNSHLLLLAALAGIGKWPSGNHCFCDKVMVKGGKSGCTFSLIWAEFPNESLFLKTILWVTFNVLSVSWIQYYFFKLHSLLNVFNHDGFWLWKI